jgi:hypothetical protein
MRATDRPDPAYIAAGARAVLTSKTAKPDIAIEGLMKIAENLRRTFSLSADEIRPITDLIFELKVHGRPLPRPYVGDITPT